MGVRDGLVICTAMLGDADDIALWCHGTSLDELEERKVADDIVDWIPQVPLRHGRVLWLF
jgi:hypothetical protein